MARDPEGERKLGAPRGRPSSRGERLADRCGVFVVDQTRVRPARKAVLTGDVVDHIADTFNALAHPTGVRIIQALSRGELCVCEISEVVGLSVCAASHQLRLLRSLHLVRARPLGKLVSYELSDPFVLALLEDCTRHVQRKATEP